MEVYPSPYIEHNLPLVLLSGLGEQQDETRTKVSSARQESGTKVTSSSPECHGDRAGALLQQFFRLDGSDLAWNSQALLAPPDSLKYSMKAIGRGHTLPPRKAAPAPQSPSTEGVPSIPTKTELHSPLSPLSPGSPIFPDGLFTPQWITKHQQQVPCLFVSFFDISADDSTQDEQIKTDINSIRRALSRSGFKTRFTAVLMSDRSIVQAPDLEERLSSIRRLTSLDSKTGLFFMPPMSSHAEIATFVQSMMTALQPLCVEYYRELTKHARRKKARGGPAPSASVHTGAGSQSLSTSGWNARYEFKQGIFAEFVQEMNVAERHFSAAIDELFSSEGVFEATASWSPRWEDARLVCDALAIRTLRCQLWHAQTTGAVQSWVNYKDRMRDLIDRRGKGSETYGWAAWEARWSEIMAQLITRADLSVQRAPDGRADEDGDGAMMAFQSVPEKSFAAAERLPPLQLLHHSGYWLKLAIEGTRERRRRAMAIPEEDRVPPGQSPASAVANRVRNYDCYLVLNPHEEFVHDHLGDLETLTTLATEQFEVKGQGRMMEHLKFDLAKDLDPHSGYGSTARTESERTSRTLELLLPIWEGSSWRQEEWHDLFEELTAMLNRVALLLKDHAVVVATTYEMISRSRDEGFDLSRCLKPIPAEDPAELSFRYLDDERTSPIKLSFAFESKETYVGEVLECQLTLTSLMGPASSIELAEVVLQFAPSRTVNINHTHKLPAAGDPTQLVNLRNSTEDAGALQGAVHLGLLSGQTRIVSFQLTLREAGTLRLAQASFAVRTEQFELEHVFTEETLLRAKSMAIQTGNAISRKSLPQIETTMVNVLPKPPKVRIVLHGSKREYYTDERLRLSVEIVNEEADAVSGTIMPDPSEDETNPLEICWADEENGGFQTGSLGRELSLLQPGDSRSFDLLVKLPSAPAEASLLFDLSYTLASDPSTSLSKTHTVDLTSVTPFRAQYTFGPALNPGAWPSYFDPAKDGTEDRPEGIPQLWRLSSELHSLAKDELALHETEVLVQNVLGDSECSVSVKDSPENQVLPVDRALDRDFQLLTQKHSLEERRPTTLEMSLRITWSRDLGTSNQQISTTTLPIPRLTLPVSEPRALCTLTKDLPDEADAILQYWIENPSTHFLTFALTMEASEDFAFSGPKYRTLSLAPLSRHRVDYHITLYDYVPGPKETGQWVWPSLQVMDSYYQKNLKVHPGSADVKLDEKQAIGVWIEMA